MTILEIDELTTTYKDCKHCGVNQNLLQFTKNKSSKNGIGAHCLSCERARAIRKRQKNPRSARESQIRSKYGITKDVYVSLMLAQNNSCKICGIPRHELGKELSVDHCHKTGVIRGLLCLKCNSGLGMFQDEPVLVERALEYLKAGQARWSGISLEVSEQNE